ncbi:hypothetical protein V5F34_01180 [Xanthobacter autotrophicus]|uniref:hypothetical protein n=1 Tax=Xanthobacter autotrophicus TaxID=280 RepID=UPI0037285376
MKQMLIVGVLALVLSGCATNGNGLIGSGGHVSGSYTVYEPGKAPLVIPIK